MSGMELYENIEQVYAKPMTYGEYLSFKGTDSGKALRPDMKGYIVCNSSDISDELRIIRNSIWVDEEYFNLRFVKPVAKPIVMTEVRNVALTPMTFGCYHIKMGLPFPKEFVYKEEGFMISYPGDKLSRTTSWISKKEFVENSNYDRTIKIKRNGVSPLLDNRN